MLAAISLVGASGAEAQGPEAGSPEEIPQKRSRVGPVWMSDDGRSRVRGMRAEGASIHLAYSPSGKDPDAQLRKALAEFELATFPPTQAPQLRQTIVDEPPEEWMRQLELPALPVRWNQKTIEYLRYFKDDPRGKRLMRAWYARKSRYEPEIRRIFDEVGVPQDLMFVALIESGFRPGNTNPRTGAGGMWQFMEPTGRVYGLMSDYWFDDRYDYEKATYAAAAYLDDLRVRFGSWEMALASYNAGYGLVMKTVRRNNTNNYWALCEIEAGLPYSTSNYVPKLIAAAIAARNPKVFGLDDVKGKSPAVLVEVQVPPSTRLKDLATAIDMDEDLLVEFNARLRRGRTPPKGGPFTVRIPREKLGSFEAADAKLRAASQKVQTHTTLLGEDLPSLAREYGITERELRRMNGIRESGEIHGGITLVVPGPRVAAGDQGADQKGDHKPALPLVAVPPLEVPGGKRLVFMRTTRATTPRRISQAFGFEWKQVLAWNDLDPKARLQDGLMLQLVVAADFDGPAAGVRVYEQDEVMFTVRGTREHLDAMLEQRDLERRGYKVRKGDTLKAIAKRFKTSIGSLARINAIRRSKPLEAGEVLVVYVEKGKTKGTVKAPAPTSTTLTAELETLASGEGEPGKKRAPSTAETSRLPGSSNTKGGKK